MSQVRKPPVTSRTTRARPTSTPPPVSPHPSSLAPTSLLFHGPDERADAHRIPSPPSPRPQIFDAYEKEFLEFTASIARNTSSLPSLAGGAPATPAFLPPPPRAVAPRAPTKK